LLDSHSTHIFVLISSIVEQGVSRGFDF